MKKKLPLFFILILVAINLLSNSCKKDTNSNIPHLLTSGVWQLASVLVYNYVGNAQTGDPDTLNTTCTKTQFFTFKTDNTCTYTNFDCLDQTTNGTWKLTENKLYFSSNMVVKDTLPGGRFGTDTP
ncbi:MAG TPA: lipocalin family protein, partial [Mucilaginibacter sp.]